MARPRNLTPPLRQDGRSGQWCIYINRRRRLLGHDKKAAEKRRLDLIGRRLAEPTAASADDLLVAEALTHFLNHARTRFADAPKTLHRIQRVRQLFGLPYGHVLAAEVNAGHVEDWQEALKQDGYSRRYIKHLRGTLRMAFKWLRKRRLIPADVLEAVREADPVRGAKQPPAVSPVEGDAAIPA